MAPLRIWGASLLAMLFLGLATPAQGQDEEVAPTAQYPPAFEAATRAQAVQEAASSDLAAVTTLGEVDGLRADVQVERNDLNDVRALIGTIAEAEYMRPERISRMRDRALQHSQRSEAIRERAGARLNELSEFADAWQQRRDFWQSWREALSAANELAPVQSAFARALEHIDEVLAGVEEATSAVLAVQQEAIGLQMEATRLADEVAAIRAGRREALLQAGQPVLFSSTYFAELGPELIERWSPVEAVLHAGYRTFLAANVGLLALHLLLALGLVFAARWLRERAPPTAAWAGLLARPWAFALFASTALLRPGYVFEPPMWDVVTWALLAGAGVVLATSLIRSRSIRIVLYYFAAFYPLILLVEAIQVPVPIVRPLLVLLAAIGIASFVALLKRESTRAPASGAAKWTLGLSALMWFVVLVAEILGFYLLARWVLHATITSAYVVLLVVFLMLFARGASSMIVRLEKRDHRGLLGTVGYPLAERLLWLFQVILVVIAALHVFDIWEITPSPTETWGRITAVGFTVAGVQITVGRILTAVVLVYLAVLISWLIRAFNQSELYPRWELERGVGDSINTLVHYLLITIGFLVGLSVLGVELRNFAIVAGALGVGIGFGLQNIVNNFVSGLILLFERPVRVGDTVVVGAELGTIHKIGLRSTTVVTFDKAEVIVPNADLVSEKVTNWTLTDPVARLVVPVGVAYGSDVKRVLEILGEVAEQHPSVLSFPESQPLFKEFGDSALEFELRVWVQEIRFRLAVRSDLLAEIDRRFREEGIEIPFPQRDLHLRSVDARLLESALGSRSTPSGGEESGSSPPDARS